MKLGGRPFYIRHRDDEWYDEIRVVTVPRYKTSGLSGDEWRTSVRIHFLRKGQVLKERSVHDLRTALMVLPGMGVSLVPVGDDADRKFVGEDDYCFQPGCAQRAVSEYRLQKEYCSEGAAHETPTGDYRRKFCQRHLRRGDCGLEDADDNYLVLSGPGPAEAAGW